MKPSTKKTLLMCLAITLYIMMGGFIFSILERANELEEYSDFKMRKLEAQHLIKNSNLTHQQQDILLEFMNTKYTPHEFNFNKWTFVGSCFFSMTLISTIGYGTYAPETPIGRSATFWYGVFGIALATHCTSYFGSRTLCGVLRLRRWVRKKLSKDLTCNNNDSCDAVDYHVEGCTVNLSIATALTVVWVLFGGLLMFGLQLNTDDVWPVGSGIYWSWITTTTVGFGDLIPTTDLNRTFAVLFIFSGLGILSNFMGLLISTLSVNVDNIVQMVPLLRDSDERCQSDVNVLTPRTEEIKNAQRCSL